MAKTALFVRKQSGGMFEVVNETLTTGSIFFVDSVTGTNSVGGGRNPDAPLATLNYAIGLCTANKGDMIYLMPGHSETISAAAGFDVTVAGVRIVGLGWGTLRPTFNFTATAGQVIINANNVSFENLRFTAGISAVVSAVVVNGKTDVTFKNCEWYWGGTTGWDFILGLELKAGSNRVIVDGCRFLQEPAVAGAVAAIQLTGASHNVAIQKSEFMGDCSTACVNGITTLSQGLMFLANTVHNTAATKPYLSVLTGTTGVIAYTQGLASGATIAANAVADAMAHVQNFVTNSAGTIAIVKGAGGSPALDAD